MSRKNQKSVLVIFGDDSPKKKKSWWQQFDEVITKDKLEELTSTGSNHEAYKLVNELSNLLLPDGSRLAKIINYHGYELWWMHYDSICDNFCLPYTQYAFLLSYLKDFDKVCLFQPPHPDLFEYYLKAYHCQCHILRQTNPKRFLPLPFGVILQIILSAFFLFWLAIARPKLMLWTSDKFALPDDCDFRYKFIYQELRKRKVLFVEFVRSMESWSTVLNHARQRKRPVFYSAAVISLIYYLSRFFSQRYQKKLAGLLQSEDSEERFWLQVAAHYLQYIKGTIWSIQIIKFILRRIGTKAAIITTGCNRTFHELLACKLANIRTIGIQHGAKAKQVSSYDFMPWFDGEKTLMPDRFGLWSKWWQDYYLKNSKAFKPEQFYVSGPMRPLTSVDAELQHANQPKKGPVKVLFISEQLAVPKEVLPYLLTVLEVQDFQFFLKFRPYRDGFELWLKEKQPEVYQRILGKAQILRGTMEEAADICDVVVGSHSTSVLEALLRLKPFVFFRTNKWGDHFDIKSFDDEDYFFAENPEDLIKKIKKSVNISKENLKKLQERFFGDPRQNGSKWVVEQALEFTK